MGYLIDNVKNTKVGNLEEETKPLIFNPFGTVLPDKTDVRPYSPMAYGSISINRNKSTNPSNAKTLEGLTVSDNLRQFLGKRESNNNYQATNRKSSAAGKYQFLWNLWGKDITKVTGVKTKEEFLRNPKAQEDFYTWHENTNIKPHIAELRKYDVHGLTDNQLGAMIHFRGLANAKQVVSQDLNTLKEKYNMTPQQYIQGLKAWGGDTYSAIGQGLGFLGQGLDSLDTSTSSDLKVPKFSNALGSAGKGLGLGATIGSAIPVVGTAVGAVVGGAIGLGAGLLKNRQQTREMNEEKRKRDGRMATINEQYMSVLQGNRMAGYPIQGVKNVYGYYAYGGKIKKYATGGMPVPPEYEVEKGEVVQGTGVELEHSKQLASDMHAVEGQKHEDGGTQGAGGERVFSDRLMISPILYNQLKQQGFKVDINSTYAQVAKLLGAKKGKFEEKIESANPYAINTGVLVGGRIDSLIELTYQIQEMEKGSNGVPQQARMFAYGGKLPKMAGGGPTPTKKVVLKASGDSDESYQYGHTYKIKGRYYTFNGSEFESTDSSPKNVPNSANNILSYDKISLNDAKKLGATKSTYQEALEFDKAAHKAELAKRQAAMANEQKERAKIDSVNKIYKQRIAASSNTSTTKPKTEWEKYGEQLKKSPTFPTWNQFTNGIAESDHPVDRIVSAPYKAYKYMSKKFDDMSKSTSIYDGIKNTFSNAYDALTGKGTKTTPSDITVSPTPPTLKVPINNSAKINLPMPKEKVVTGKKKVVRQQSVVGNENRPDIYEVAPTTAEVKNLTANPQVAGVRKGYTYNAPTRLTQFKSITVPTVPTSALVNNENNRFKDKWNKFLGSDAGDLVKRFGVPTALNLGNYLTNRQQINKLETDYNPTLNSNPVYGYTDRSFATKVQLENAARNAYNALDGVGTQNRNSYRGAIFSSYLNSINQANASENQRLDAYNANYNNQAMQVNMSNVGIMNDAAYRSLEARNAKRQMNLENSNNLFSNVTASIKEDADLQTQNQAYNYLKKYYNNRGGLADRVLAQ